MKNLNPSSPRLTINVRRLDSESAESPSSPLSPDTGSPPDTEAWIANKRATSRFFYPGELADGTVGCRPANSRLADTASTSSVQPRSPDLIGQLAKAQLENRLQKQTNEILTARLQDMQNRFVAAQVELQLAKMGFSESPPKK